MDENPYRAPEALGPAGPGPAAGPGATWRVLAWAGVYGLNLVVPLLFGWTFTRDFGRLGMAAAVALYLVAGAALAVRAPVLGRLITAGGAVVALSQLAPMLQIMAGAIGVGVTQQFGLVGDHERILSEPGGFLATAVTGALLLAAAAAAGALLWLVTPRRWWQAGPDPVASRPSAS